MEPFDYTLNVVDPIQAGLQAYGNQAVLGQNAQRIDQDQQRLQMAQEAQAFDMERARAADALAAQQRAQAQAEADRAKQAEAAFAAYVMDPVKTYDKTLAVVQKFPQLAESVMTQWQGMNEAEQANMVKFGKETAYALSQGNTAVAEQMLRSRITAAENSGDAQEAATYKAQLQLLQSGPEGAATVQALAMTSLASVLPPDDFKAFVEATGAQEAGFRKATPEEAAAYGAVAGQFGPDGRFYPIDTGGGEVIRSDGKGGLEIIRGAGAGAAEEPSRESERAKLVAEDISRAKSLISGNPMLTSGFFGNTLKEWAGTPAADTKALIETIKANIGFNELAKIRAEVGSVGPLTDRDMVVLQSLAGSLEQSQSPEQLLQNLTRIEEEMNRLIRADLSQSGASGSPDLKASAAQKLRAAQQAKGGKLTPSEARAALTPEEAAAVGL